MTMRCTGRMNCCHLQRASWMLVQVALVNTDHATAVDSDTRVSVRTASLEHTVTMVPSKQQRYPYTNILSCNYDLSSKILQDVSSAQSHVVFNLMACCVLIFSVRQSVRRSDSVLRRTRSASTVTHVPCGSRASTTNNAIRNSYFNHPRCRNFDVTVIRSSEEHLTLSSYLYTARVHA